MAWSRSKHISLHRGRAGEDELYLFHDSEPVNCGVASTQRDNARTLLYSVNSMVYAEHAHILRKGGLRFGQGIRSDDP